MLRSQTPQAAPSKDRAFGGARAGPLLWGAGILSQQLQLQDSLGPAPDFPRMHCSLRPFPLNLPSFPSPFPGVRAAAGAEGSPCPLPPCSLTAAAPVALHRQSQLGGSFLRDLNRHNGCRAPFPWRLLGAVLCSRAGLCPHKTEMQAPLLECLAVSPPPGSSAHLLCSLWKSFLSSSLESPSSADGTCLLRAVLAQKPW